MYLLPFLRYLELHLVNHFNATLYPSTYMAFAFYNKKKLNTKKLIQNCMNGKFT